MNGASNCVGALADFLYRIQQILRGFLNARRGLACRLAGGRCLARAVAIGAQCGFQITAEGAQVRAFLRGKSTLFPTAQPNEVGTQPAVR